MSRLRFGGIHDEYSLQMYKKMYQNNPDILVEEPKAKPKDRLKPKPKNSKTPLTITGLKTHLTRNKVKYI